MKSKHLPLAFDLVFSILMNIQVEPKFKLKNSLSKEGPQLKWDLLHFIRMPCLSPFWSVIFSVFSQPHSKYSDISVFVRADQIRYIKSITVLMKTSFTQTVSYAPSHPVTGVCVGNFRKRGCPWHPAGKICMTSLICIDFSRRLGTCSHLNFPTCSRLLSPRCTSQSHVNVPVDINSHFNRILNAHTDCTWSQNTFHWKFHDPVCEGHVSEIEEQATSKRTCEFKSCVF